MGNLENKLHSPGVMIYRAKGDLTSDDLEKWRDELGNFIKEHGKLGACGVLVDVCEVEGFSSEALDTLLELLSDPEETIRDVRMRFALIGVKPFTQRFLRETMPVEEVKHIRARFFHEVAEDEALAWLQAMVSSAEGLPEVTQAAPTEKAKEEPKPLEKLTEKAIEKKPEAEKRPETEEKKPKPEKKPEQRSEPAKRLAALLKGDSRSPEKKPDTKSPAPGD